MRKSGFPVRVSLLVVFLVAPFILLGVGAAAGAGGQAGASDGPRFLTGPRRGDPLAIVLRYLRKHRQELGLTAADIADVVVTDRYVSAHTGVTHLYLRQRYNGVEVFDGNLNVNVARNGSLISLHSGFVPNLEGMVEDAPDSVRLRSAEDTVRGVAERLGLKAPPLLDIRELRGGPARETIFGESGISLEPIRTMLVYQRVAGDRLRLAWMIELYEPSAKHWWNLRADAETGEILARSDYVADSDDTYNVFALPKESPSDGPRTLEVNPADPTASPFGWHDTDGVAGAEFTVTRGNNAHAYTDLNADNVADPGSDPDGGAGLVFDFPLDLTQGPSTYRPAAVANLFYWNNIIHDVTYHYGFDEASGNFQVNNYGGGGLGNDDVRAEAQDGSGLNNANFGTPTDGNRPRMQMFVWIPPGGREVTVNAPSPIAASYPATGALFGPQLSEIGPISGDVALADDGSGVTTDACQPLVGFPAGSIALVDRGACTFVSKAINAQNAGAIAMIVGNSVAGSPITMGGANLTITIPSVMVSLDNANLFKANLPFNATLAFTGEPQPSRDSDIDSGVIAHEYTHGISNRLTGGPGTVSCLSSTTDPEQMGEGWSDWVALALTAISADTATTSRGIGTYVIFEPPTGNGIRPTPYTTDLGVNPTTYGDIGGLAVPHGVGYAWASMLWEVYWNLVTEWGFNSNIYGDWTTGGNNLAVQLVMDGMKIQPCLPGFVDGRDAILLADQVLTSGNNQCLIWRGFAKRGLGFSANQGSSASTTDGTEAFDLPSSCHEFSGFFGPIANAPAMNDATAGSTVPVIFSLDGNQGLDIFAPGYPASREVDCSTGEPLGDLEPTVTPGKAKLSYDPTTDEYTYPWKTKRAWAGTCREVRVRMSGDASNIAVFNFR